MPSAIFVSSNGSMSDIYQMQENMRVMAADESRSRELSDFEINRVGDVTIVGLSNHVIYKQNNRHTEMHYLMRLGYSRILLQA